MYLDETAIKAIVSWPCHHAWAATSKEKPCHLACQSFRNFLDLGLKSTNHHKHSWSRWLPWRLLNLRPMCLDWQMQVNVRLLADTNVKIMKLNQEEMCRLHSRVKTKTMHDIVIKLWFVMPSSYFWGLQCSPKLMVAVWLDSNCESHEIWDVPWCTSEILTPWHLRTSASWCPWSSMLFIRTKRSFFENCYSEASTCGIATARRWQAFRIFRKWLNDYLIHYTLIPHSHRFSDAGFPMHQMPWTRYNFRSSVWNVSVLLGSVFGLISVTGWTGSVQARCWAQPLHQSLIFRSGFDNLMKSSSLNV